MEKNGLSDIEGKAAREAVSEMGAERVSKQEVIG
jgi:phosphoribosylformylglycinamidine (FGAM) synthase PurS component